MQKTISVINLSAIRKNALFIRGLLGAKKFYAVVKADAYGHGAEAVSAEIEDVADGFCVAIAEEGAALRIAGITKPVLVFTPPADLSDVDVMRHYALTATVNGVNAARLIGDIPCHIKVNTGMNRYGCEVGELPQILKILSARQVEGVYSHLFAAENEYESAKQLRLFLAAERVVKAYNPDAVAHLSASGGLLRGGKFLRGGARCGIALYGYAPYGFSCPSLTPALKVYAKRVQTARFIGGGIGYQRAAEQYKTLSTYRLGYADGFARGVPLGEGNLCMDGFISREKADTLCVFDDADAYAKRCGTIAYEVLCSVTRRSERIYEK